MKWFLTLAVVAVVAASILYASLQPASAAHVDAAAPAQSAPPPPTVTVAPASTRVLGDSVELTARMQAQGDVELRARVSGHLQSVHFQNGALVKRGELLFTLDPRWYQATLDAAQAALAQARVRVQNSEREAARADALLAKQAISTEEAEGRTSRLAEARAALASAEASVTAAQLDLEFTQVRAPIDGRVDRAFVTVGNFVSGIPSANTVLTTIVSLDPIYVDADLDEVTLLRLRRALDAHELPVDGEGRVQVEFGLADEDGFPQRAAIDSLGNRVDASTGSIRVRAVVANPDGRFVPGSYARLRIPTSAAVARVLVPERAIGTDQSQRYVLVVAQDDTVAYRTVVLGRKVGDERVVESGLAAGERIVVNGLQRARPGARVTPELEQPASDESASEKPESEQPAHSR